MVLHTIIVPIICTIHDMHTHYAQPLTADGSPCACAVTRDVMRWEFFFVFFESFYNPPQLGWRGGGGGGGSWPPLRRALRCSMCAGRKLRSLPGSVECGFALMHYTLKTCTLNAAGVPRMNAFTKPGRGACARRRPTSLQSSHAGRPPMSACDNHIPAACPLPRTKSSR